MHGNMRHDEPRPRAARARSRELLSARHRLPRLPREPAGSVGKDSLRAARLLPDDKPRPPPPHTFEPACLHFADAQSRSTGVMSEAGRYGKDDFVRVSWIPRN